MAKKSLAALACWIAALAALFVILRAGHPSQAHLVHSDALFLPVLFDDLVHHGGRLADWFLTPAPYFFPDFLMYAVAWPAGGVFEQTTAFALLQCALAALALMLLARQALARAWLPAAASLAILFIWLGLNGGDPFVRLFGSAHHYGAFIAALLLYALWLAWEGAATGARKRLAGAAIAVLVALTTLSDALFLPQTVLPLLVAVVLLGAAPAQPARPRRAQPVLPLMLLLLPALAGILSYRFAVTHPTRFAMRPSLAQLPRNLDELHAILAVVTDTLPVLAAVLLAALGFGAACLFAGLRRRPLWGLPRALQLLGAFATLSFLATLGAMLLSRTAAPVPRYLIGALSWPLIAGLFALVHLLGTRKREGGAALGLGLCMLFSGALSVEAWRMHAVRNAGQYYYPGQIACIDRTLAAAGARYGIAQYWDAKRLQALSRQQLTLAQFTGELDKMEWITSERFYRTGYDFAIVADQEPAEFRLPRDRLAAASGAPLQAVACGDRTVLLYMPGKLRVPAPPARAQ